MIVTRRQSRSWRALAIWISLESLLMPASKSRLCRRVRRLRRPGWVKKQPAKDCIRAGNPGDPEYDMPADVPHQVPSVREVGYGSGIQEGAVRIQDVYPLR